VVADDVPPEIAQLYLTPSLQDVDKLASVMFSGGVSEYVYGHEERDFADLGKPLTIVLDGDIAQSIGTMLHEEGMVSCPVLVIDGITLHDFEFIDVGRWLEPSHTVPVTIKSLIFK
jgi:ethanolamine utilization protein EutA (predicted chaperonin)